MPQYVDGFVLPVPARKLAKYKKIATKAGKIWKEHGALEYHECVGEEVEMPGMTAFTKTAGCKKGEVVIFSWIVYKSKAHRNAVNKKVMSDPRMAKMCDPKDMPFDCARMAWGGFKSLVKS